MPMEAVIIPITLPDRPEYPRDEWERFTQNTRCLIFQLGVQAKYWGNVASTTPAEMSQQVPLTPWATGISRGVSLESKITCRMGAGGGGTGHRWLSSGFFDDLISKVLLSKFTEEK